MLEIVVPLSAEGWDEEKEEFVQAKEQILRLEHSLISLRKWESKWCKPFLTKEAKTEEETVDYVKFMTMTPNVNPDVYNHLTDENFRQIKQYIEAPMTATTFSKHVQQKRGRINGEQVTAELIYYWMVALQIPFECQKWHLNQLITLIQVCNVKNQPPKKMGKKDLTSHYAALNAANRQRFNSKG